MNQNVDVVQLSSIIGNKHRRGFFIKTDKSEVTVNLKSPLNLDQRLHYTMKLRSFNGWQSVININDNNNTFRYMFDTPDAVVKQGWITITLPRGLFSIKQINDYMQSVMKEKGHYDSVNNAYYIKITVDENQNRCYIILSNNYKLDLSISDIYLLFGLEKKIYDTPQNVKIFAPNIGKMSDSLEMIIFCSLVEPNTFVDTNGEIKHIQYLTTYPLYLTPPNSRINIRDSNPDKFQVIKSKYNDYSFTIKLMNERFEPLDFNGETSFIHVVLESS